MSSLLVFNRVYRMEIQSVMLALPPPLPCLNKNTVQYTRIQCLGGGGGGGVGEYGVIGGEGALDR